MIAASPIAWRLAFLFFAIVASAFPNARAAELEPQPFQPPGMWIWDNWFVHDGQRWHAFYLQLPKAVGSERRWTNNDFYKHVGHAVSDDLVKWRDVGPALGALPGTWNDRHIATGSIIRQAGRWWMFFTSRGQRGDGVGLALSDDLLTWKTEPRPLFPLIGPLEADSQFAFVSSWNGEPRRWIGISDPYIYPESVDGWFYLLLAARVLDVPLEESGCLPRMRSRNLRDWEPAGIMAWPRAFERMETPQLWLREGHWYVSFGGVLNMPWAQRNLPRLPAAVAGKPSHRNYYYVWGDFRQPAHSEQMHFIDVPTGNYIMKVQAVSGRNDLALFTSTDARGTCLSLPYRVSYLPDGSLQVRALPLNNVTK